MSQAAFQLLRAIGLLTDQNAVAAIDRIDPTELSARLRYYHDARAGILDREISRISESQPGNCALLSSMSANPAVTALVPKLLVQKALVVDDPVHYLATPMSPITQMERNEMGMRTVDTIDPVKLKAALSYFANVARLAEAGMIYILPLRALHRPPHEIPITIPINRYRERVPESACEFVFGSVRVRPMQPSADGLRVLNQENSDRCPQVCIDFLNDGSPFKNFYRYSETTWKDEGDGAFSFEIETSSKKPVDPKMYESWIEQSINQSIGIRLESIGREMHVADRIGATYLTESDFEAQLLTKSGQADRAGDRTAVNFLETNSDMLRLESLESILRLRSDNEQLMDRFRLSVENIAEQLKGLEGNAFNEKARKLFESEVQPQIQEVNTAIQKIPEAAAKGAITTSVAVFLGILSGIAIPAAAYLSAIAAGATAESIPTVGDYLRLRKQPQFVWHKLKKP